jgi:transposase
VPTRLGVDEKAAAKGHRYLTLVCDLEQATVEYIADDRKQASLDGYFQGLTDAQRAGIEAVAMDMWEPYIQSVLTHLPEGARKIVFDRFHIMGHMGDAVDHVRKQEHRALRAAGDETLTGSKYLWLYGAERMPEQHQDRFLVLQALNLKRRGRGRSRRPCGSSGATAARPGRSATGRAGTSGQPTPGCSR